MSDKRNRMAAWLKGDGIEIGAYDNPLPVPHDARVTYVDRLSVEELHSHYDPDGTPPDLHPVTVIAKAEDLSPFAMDSLDFVIANHLIEHVENPVRALVEFHRVLRPGGVVYLAVPDSRVTFDAKRALTTTEHVLDEWRNGPERNRRDHYLDYVLHVDRVLFADIRTDTVDERVDYWMSIGYGIHFHVWHPDTFLDFLFSAKREAGLDFELVAFASQEEVPDNELIVILAKGFSDEPRRPPVHDPVPVPEPVPPVPSPADEVPVPALTGWPRVRSELAASPLAPVLRPGYRFAKRLLKR